jgi:hypothetical protein
MASTMQQIIDRTRPHLKDPNKTRFTDAQCLDALNDALRESRRFRPDLWHGSLNAAFAARVAGDAWPIDETYEAAAIKCLIFWCDSRNSEFNDDGRAIAFMKMWQGYLNA